MKFINNETINHFKKFIAKLYKKEEDTYLNKKKKREEAKQKNKNEKSRVNNRAVNGNNGYNQYNNYYQGLYLPPQMQPMNNPNPQLDYQNYYFYNPYQLPPPHIYSYPQYYQQYFIGPPKSLEESLNNIYQRGIVNNIIGAFFIKEQLEKIKNSEKRKVPISTVELREDQGNNSPGNNNSNINSSKANENTGDKNKNEDNNNKSAYLKEENKQNNSEENNGGNKEENGDDKNDKENEKKNIMEEKEEKDNGIYEQNNINHDNELKKPNIIF